MSVEIEVKYRVNDPEELLAKVQALAGPPASGADQTDRYFTHPARNFAETDEALRIRSQGEENRITYKGPRQAGPTKTREEIEVAVREGAEGADRMTRLLERLGFRPLAAIHKHRTEFDLDVEGRPMKIAVDEAGELGAFAEVETIAHDERDVPNAQKAVLDLARSLGLTEVEPRSYLRMNLERRRG
jgi:adenylate cyclase class 2